MQISERHLKQINNLVTNLIPLNVCRYHKFLPISIEKTEPPSLFVAMVNPKNIPACHALKKYLKVKNLQYQKMVIMNNDYQRLMGLYDKYRLKLNSENKIYQCFQDLDYNNHLKKVNKKYQENQPQPQSYDLVLGGEKNQIKQCNSVVLGGIEGIEFRFKSNNLATKVVSLHESLKYKNIAVNLLTKTLQEEKGILVWIAYSLLKKIPDLEVQKNRLEYELKLTKENLSGVNLEGLNLKGINLEKANLRKANFKGAIINEHTKINPKLLLIWKIVNQGLHNHNLSDIELCEANLTKCTITDVILNQALFFDIDFSDANLIGIDFNLAKFNNINMENATLNHLMMKSCILKKTNFAHANLSQINFNESYLSEVDFRESNLKEVDFSKSHLSEVDFSNANLSGVYFKDAILNKVNFTKAILHNVDMSYLNLSSFNVNLSQVDLRHSKFIRSNLKGLNLSGANLSKANLSGANLMNTNLKDVNLNDAKLFLATYNHNTTFPNNFDPKRSGAVLY